MRESIACPAALRAGLNLKRCRISVQVVLSSSRLPLVRVTRQAVGRPLVPTDTKVSVVPLICASRTELG